MNTRRSRHAVAKRAVFGTLLAGIVLSGCANPYATPEIDPNLKAPVAEEGAPAPKLETVGPQSEKNREKGTEVTDLTTEDPRAIDEAFFGIDPASVEIPAEYTERFGESAKDIARDALYTISTNASFRQYQNSPLTPADHPLLVASMQDMFSTTGKQTFADAIAKAGSDPSAQRLAFAIMPFSVQERFTTIDGVEYNIDPDRLWDVQVWNPYFLPILEDGVSDAAVFGFNRTVYIPVQDNQVIRVDSYIEYSLIINGEGNWVIDGWFSNHADPELEK